MGVWSTGTRGDLPWWSSLRVRDGQHAAGLVGGRAGRGSRRRGRLGPFARAAAARWWWCGGGRRCCARGASGACAAQRRAWWWSAAGRRDGPAYAWAGRRDRCAAAGCKGDCKTSWSDMQAGCRLWGVWSLVGAGRALSKDAWELALRLARATQLTGRDRAVGVESPVAGLLACFAVRNGSARRGLRCGLRAARRRYCSCVLLDDLAAWRRGIDIAVYYSLISDAVMKR